MLEKYFRHVGWKLLLLMYFCPYCCGLPDGDLCRWMNGRKYYIDVGESGIISAENVTSQTRPGSSDQPQIPQRCSVELVTCASCHFRIRALHINIPSCSADATCRCDFVWVKESAYSKLGHEFCGQLNGSARSLVFESKTKQVSVDFLYTGTYESAFALHFSAIKNVYVFKGGYDYYQGNSSGAFSSPNFPGGYPSDYSAEYILQNADTSGFVQLLFTDFQLSLWSYMEVLDSNGSRIDVYNGNTFRPPAIISSGPTLTIKFQANEEYSSSGFYAAYTFVGYGEKYWVNRPSTDCGGVVEDLGGAITMMNMVPGNMMQAFDCIWLLRPHGAGVAGKQVSVRVAQFEDMGPKSTLSIRQGLYSSSPLLESVTPFQHHELHRGQEYVVPASIGFYIRLIGYLKDKSHLAIVYSTFQYEGCFALVDFECGNGRCVKSSLRCDGFNHCGDGTDESSCYGANQGTQNPEDANWWRTLTPNYYFPKSESGHSAGTNTLILVTSLAGLGMFVLTTVVILVKLHKQRQDDTISREILQTISADIEAENALHQHRGSDPPLYDPPPSYDDVIKFYLPPPPAYSRVGSSRGSGEGTARDHRRKQPKQASSLQVALPEEDSRPPSLPAKSTADSEAPLHPKPSDNPANNESTSPGLVATNVLGLACHRSNPQNANSACECQGACSCSTEPSCSARKSSFSRARWPRKTAILNPNLKRASSAKQSLSQVAEQVAVKKPKPGDSPDAPNQRISASDCLRMTLRRSSSDPSEISLPETHGSRRGEQPKTADSSPENRTFATGLLSGLHGSLASRRGSADGKGEKNLLPLGWGHLWNPVRRRPHEAAHLPAGAVPWSLSDTQPLLRKPSPKTCIVETTVQPQPQESENR